MMFGVVGIALATFGVAVPMASGFIYRKWTIEQEIAYYMFLVGVLLVSLLTATAFAE